MVSRLARLTFLVFTVLAAPCLAQEPGAPTESPQAEAQHAGQADLDRATELKLNSSGGIRELNRVIQLLESSLDKGLDADNASFAEEMLAGSLMQRASAVAAAALRQPSANPQANPQILQLRLVALRDLQRVVELAPNKTEAYLLIGQLQSAPAPVGNPKAAWAALSKVIEAKGVEDVKLAQAYALRSATAIKPQDRIADLNKAIELDPDKLAYLKLRAQHYINAKQFDKAMADADLALGIDPKNASLQQLKATAYAAQGKLNEALKHLEKASELDPENLTYYGAQSELLEKLGDSDKALQILDKVLEKKPGSAAVYLLRINLLLKNQRLEEALKDVDELLKQQPDMAVAQMLRTQLLTQLNRDDEALAALEKLAKRMPRRPEVHLQLAAHYMDRNQPSKAIASLTTVLELAKGNEVALRLRGDMYLSTGEHAKALADFEAAYNVNPEDSGLLNNYAWTLATSPFDELRDGPLAVEIATKACELTSYKAAHILSTLAAAYAETGDFDKAVEWSQKAVELSGASTEDDIDEELAKELASYKSGKPWRELQQTQDAESPAEEKKVEEPSDEPAPARTIDF